MLLAVAAQARCRVAAQAHAVRVVMLALGGGPEVRVGERVAAGKVLGPAARRERREPVGVRAVAANRLKASELLVPPRTRLQRRARSGTAADGRKESIPFIDARQMPACGADALDSAR